MDKAHSLGTLLACFSGCKVLETSVLNSSTYRMTFLSKKGKMLTNVQVRIVLDRSSGNDRKYSSVESNFTE